MRVLLFAALLAAANAASLRFSVMDDSLTELWEAFKTKHRKVYESPEHESLR